MCELSHDVTFTLQYLDKQYNNQYLQVNRKVKATKFFSYIGEIPDFEKVQSEYPHQNITSLKMDEENQSLIMLEENRKLSTSHLCTQCNQTFTRISKLKQHTLTRHSKPLLVKRKNQLPTIGICRISQQVPTSNIFKTLTFYPKNEEDSNLDVFLENLTPQLQHQLEIKNGEKIIENRMLKWYISIKIDFRQPTDDNFETFTHQFSSELFINYAERNFQYEIDTGYTQIRTALEDFTGGSSDWKIRCMELQIINYGLF